MKKSDAYDIKLDRSALSFGTLREEGDEKSYWLAASPAQRLEAIEVQRQILYGYDQTTTRLQRILEITQLPKG
jgi:hypothetical protein